MSNDIEKASAVISDWVSQEKFCEKFPNIPLKTLKWQLTARSYNGLASAVQLMGKKRYISITRYAAWLESKAPK